jgi:hypothetical protein
MRFVTVLIALALCVATASAQCANGNCQTIRPGQAYEPQAHYQFGSPGSASDIGFPPQRWSEGPIRVIVVPPLTDPSIPPTCNCAAIYNGDRCATPPVCPVGVCYAPASAPAVRSRRGLFSRRR